MVDVRVRACVFSVAELVFWFLDGPCSVGACFFSPRKDPEDSVCVTVSLELAFNSIKFFFFGVEC